MNELMNNLPLLIPIIIVDFALRITAFVHVLKHPSYRFGNKVIWSLLVLVIGLIGPIAYFTIGRGED